MNKFESSLLQTLSSIDESLKILATGKPPVAPKAPAPAAKQPVKQPDKKAKKAGNGKVPKAVVKTVKALEKSSSKAPAGKPA